MPMTRHMLMLQVDTSVELSPTDNSLLSDIRHLALEVTVNGHVVDKVNLISRNTSPGVWDADNILVLCVF
jgi:hypothetical protein